jgi:hypothetical protein
MILNRLYISASSFWSSRSIVFSIVNGILAVEGSYVPVTLRKAVMFHLFYGKLLRVIHFVEGC